MSFRHNREIGTNLEQSALAHRMGRGSALLVLLLVVGIGCANRSVETSAATRGSVASASQPDVEQLATEDSTTAPTVVAVPTVIAAPTAVPTVEAAATATSAPLLIATSGVVKNQPVFRQARVDGDGRTAPTFVEVQADTTSVAGEVSAFTDQVDTYAVAARDDAQDVVISWRCTDYAADDDRPVRLIIERAGTVLGELRCAAVGSAGSTRVSISADAPLLVVVDSRPLTGPPSANLFAAYELSFRPLGVAASERSETSTAAVDPTPAPTETAAADTANEEPANEDPAPEEPAPVAPTATATATPAPTPTVEPTPTPGVVVTRPAPVDDEALGDTGAGDDEEPAIGNGRTAPADGDSRSNPQRPQDAGFLVGSVSAPGGDPVDWSSFGVGPEDPTEIFAGVLCENFSSVDGSGALTVTIYEATTAKVTLRCTASMLEDFASLTLTPGQTYFVEAAFSGTGYADWVFQAGDDD